MDDATRSQIESMIGYMQFPDWEDLATSRTLHNRWAESMYVRAIKRKNRVLWFTAGMSFLALAAFLFSVFYLFNTPDPEPGVWLIPVAAVIAIFLSQRPANRMVQALDEIQFREPPVPVRLTASVSDSTDLIYLRAVLPNSVSGESETRLLGTLSAEEDQAEIQEILDEWAEQLNSGRDEALTVDEET